MTPLNAQARALCGQWVPQKSEVLALKCGSGDLLVALKHQRQAQVFGIDPVEEHVLKAMERGISVIQAPVESRLKDYPNQSFDVVILDQTLQTMSNARAVLAESLRIGKRVLVVFPNFAYGPIRWQFLRTGRMPNTNLLSFEWYDTPNIHLFTVADLKRLCQQEGVSILFEAYQMAGQWTSAPWAIPLANLFSNQGLLVLSQTAAL